jgi:indole-3-acetate monooxygenase
VGAMYNFTTSMMGQDIELAVRVIEFVPDRRIAVAVEGPGGAMITTTTLEEADDGGTTVTIINDASALGEMANMAGAMARSAAEKDLRSLHSLLTGSTDGVNTVETEVAAGAARATDSLTQPLASTAFANSAALTARRSDLWQAAHALEPLIRKYEDQLEIDRQIPPELTDALFDAGVFTAFTPKELGGVQADPLDWLEMVEELSRISGAVGWLAMVNAGMVSVPPERFEELTENRTIRWIGAGNAGRLGGKARRVEGGYLLSGRWPFASGAPHANFLTGMAVLYDEDDQVVIHPNDGMPWVVLGTFRREDVRLIDTWDGLGVRGSGSGDFEVTDAFVPAYVADRSMKDLTYNELLFREPLFILTAHGAHAVGLAQAAFDAYIKLCNAKKADGSRRQSEMGRQQFHRMNVARADALIRSSRLFVQDSVRTAWQEIHDYDSGIPSMDTRAVMCEAMIFTVHQCREAVELVFKSAGVGAVFRGTELERVFRDMMTVAQHILVTEDRLEEFGNYWLTKDTDRPFTPMMLSSTPRTPKPQKSHAAS